MYKRQDLSFHPEFWLVHNAMDNPVVYGQKHKTEFEDLADIADLAIQGPTEKVISYLAMRLKAKSSSAFWALQTCTQLGSDDPRLVEAAKTHLDSKHQLARTYAAEYLGTIRAIDPVPTLLDVLATSESEVETLRIMNTVVFLRDFHGYKIEIDPAKVKSGGGEVSRRISYLTGQPHKKPRKKKKG